MECLYGEGNLDTLSLGYIDSVILPWGLITLNDIHWLILNTLTYSQACLFMSIILLIIYIILLK